ncbi:VanZ like family protein [Modicisalibacter ilicicola DSM 19980]|uniref:VanZ like family protein n=1 Tax=Modicisalibacter ilicicola DSM 19980 TaxID=1121942 RepID=A0A1M5ACW4_9GAMM|nr:VanZ like family protein [Halomonas ilicicola DSM 19980]
MAAALAIALGSLAPGDEMPRNLPWDKLNHFLGYGVLAALSGLAGLRPWSAWLVASGYGMLVELAQIAVPGRLGGDPYDMLANALGAAMAVLLLAALRHFFNGALFAKQNRRNNP